jgi:hypothetical protein
MATAFVINTWNGNTWIASVYVIALNSSLFLAVSTEALSTPDILLY